MPIRNTSKWDITLIEASADYCALIPPRIRQHVLDFGGAA
jgi:hypothetical protein